MNDPRTTAYALNELQGTEREKFESDLANDPLLQRDLLVACELTDALGEVAEEPVEGLEPQAKEKLLRAIAANQKAFRARRKIVRFAVPVSLAAAASIAVLLWVMGETMQGPAVAAVAGNKGAAVERIFIRSETAKIASGTAAEGDRSTNTPVPQKRVMPWDAKVLGADLGPAGKGGRSSSPGLD